MMTKKNGAETSEQQSEQFKRAVQAMVDAGELNPTEADAAFSNAMDGVAKLHQQWLGPEEDQGKTP